MHIDLSTSYMGLKLKNPLIISSSRITGNLETIKQCESYGASAIVLKSIFEEQMVLQSEARLKNSKESEAYYWFPEAKEMVVRLSRDEQLEKYLRFVKTVKENTKIPVIASINCISAEGWPKFAREIEAAGADALELNISIFPFNNSMNSLQIENLYVDILKKVKKEVSIPVSIKLGHFFTNICSIVSQLVDNGVDGLVLFNRYFRPDIDIDSLKVVADEQFSSPDEASLPLRWIALMKGNHLNCDLVASTGIHFYTGVVKQLLVGAEAVQLCSTLYQNGIPYIAELLKGLEEWMRQHHFEKIDDFRGKSLDYQTAEASFERIQYMKRDFERDNQYMS